MPGEASDFHIFHCDYQIVENASLLSDFGDFVVSGFENTQLALHKRSPINLSEFKTFNSSVKPVCVDKETYLENCKNTIDTIKSGQIDKMVLSRVTRQPVTKPLPDIFKALCNQYQNAFVYMVSMTNHGTWIGASPEQLIRIDQDNIETTALAGTKTNQSEPWGDKEKEEQAIVSRFIAQQLVNSDAHQVEQKGPYTFDTGAIFHIKTDFSAQLAKKNQFGLIKALHPTPATCGLPQKESLTFITKIEQHERLFYTGFIGPINENKAELFVNLRCMEVIDQNAYLYLGGGITKDSNPELEWEETINKSRTLTRFLD